MSASKLQAPALVRNAAALAVAGILLSLVSGCRTTRDNQIDILERELRAQEDYIYELEDYILEYSEKLRSFRATMAEQGTSVDSTPAPELAEEPPLDDEPEAADEPMPEPMPAEPEQPEAEPMLPEDLDVPDLDIGGATSLRARKPSNSLRQAAAPTRGRVAIPDPAFVPDEPAPAGPTVAEQAELDGAVRLTELEADIEQPVESIDIAEVFGGEEAKSLLTVIELLSPEEAALEGTGRVSLMVIDTRGKSPRKVQRWDFSPEEAADAWQSTPLGTGFHLELPLQAKLPETGGLELWARLTLADGRKILTRRPLQPGELLSVEAALAAEPLPAPSHQKWQARDSKPAESKLAVVKEEPVAAPVEVALVEPSRPEPVRVEPERSKPRSVGSAEVRIVTTPIPEERLQKTRDGWRASDEKRPRPPEVARAMAAVRGEDARWKKASTTTEQTDTASVPEWSPYR